MMKRMSKKTIITVLVGGGIFLLLTIVMVKLIPAPLGIDWRETYRPATLALLRGETPYNPEIAPDAPFFAAPWGLIPLIPIALLPAEIGRVVIMLVALISFAFTAYRLGASPLTMGLFLVSPPVIHCILNANMEWIPLLGFVLPPPIGLFFVSVKPQTGIAVAAFWFFDTWRMGGWRHTLRTFAPVTIALLISFLLFGLWPFGMGDVLGYGQEFNSSLWPLSIPLGLVLLGTAVQKREMKYAMPASPCLSPYVLFHAWSSAVVALVTSPLQMILAVVGLWIVVALRFLGW